MCTHLPVHVGNSRTTAFYLTHPSSARSLLYSLETKDCLGALFADFEGNIQSRIANETKGVINIFTFSLPLSLSLCKSLRGINRALSLIEVEYRSKGKMDLDIV